MYSQRADYKRRRPGQDIQIAMVRHSVQRWARATAVAAPLGLKVVVARQVDHGGWVWDVKGRVETRKSYIALRQGRLVLGLPVAHLLINVC